MTTVLISNDGYEFEFTTAMIKYMITVKEIIQEEQGESNKIPLPGVNGRTLSKTREFLHLYTNIPLPTIPAPLKEKLEYTIPSCYREFVDVDADTLFELLKASNYLNIDALLQLICAKLADIINHANHKDIELYFKVKIPSTDV